MRLQVLDRLRGLDRLRALDHLLGPGRLPAQEDPPGLARSQAPLRRHLTMAFHRQWVDRTTSKGLRWWFGPSYQTRHHNRLPVRAISRACGITPAA